MADYLPPKAPNLMRHLLFLACALFLICAAPSCARKSTPQQAKKPAEPTDLPGNSGPVLTFERTVCLGTCPAYKAEVYADGKVEYNGGLHVPVLGKKTFEIPTSQVVDMLDRAQNVDFGQLKDFYPAGVTDVPSTIIAVRQPDGQLKTVQVEGTPPAELQGFMTYLRNEFDQLAGLTADR